MWAASCGWPCNPLNRATQGCSQLIASKLHRVDAALIYYQLSQEKKRKTKQLLIYFSVCFVGFTNALHEIKYQHCLFSKNPLRNGGRFVQMRKEGWGRITGLTRWHESIQNLILRCHRYLI